MDSASSSTFRVGGLVSGLATDDIVAKLMAIERKPITQLESKKTEVTAQLTAWRDLNTRIQALQIQSTKLSDETTFMPRTVSSSDEAIIKATASTGISTSSYNVKVKTLAQAHETASGSFSGANADIGTGTVTISVGATTYSSINVNSVNNTLQSLKDAINATNHGVTASIVKQGDNNYKLVLTSKTVGAASEIKVESTLSGGESTLDFTTIQAPQDANIELGSTSGGGVPINILRPSNTITDVIDGVTLNLVSANTDKTVSIALKSNSEQVRSTITNFVSQFNNLVDYFSQQFYYDSATKKSGTLFSSSELAEIKQQIYSIATDFIPGEGKYHSLSDMGIGFDDSGKLTVYNDSMLTDAVSNNLEDVKTFFSDQTNGMGVKLDKYIKNINDPVSGMLYTTEKFFTSEIKTITDSITQKEEYMSRLETQYYNKFSKLEATLAKLKSQGSTLEAQIDAMSNANKSNNS